MANAKVEVAVQVAQRWILARLRNHRFFSLAELNVAIRRLLDELNMRVMRGYGASRADLFATLDRPNLQPLPSEPYVFARQFRLGGSAPGLCLETGGNSLAAVSEHVDLGLIRPRGQG